MYGPCLRNAENVDARIQPRPMKSACFGAANFVGKPPGPTELIQCVGPAERGEAALEEHPLHAAFQQSPALPFGVGVSRA